MQIKAMEMSSITDNSASCFLSNCNISQSNEDNMLVQSLHGMNLPEKILLVIDTIREKDCTPFKFSKGGMEANYMPLFMIKRAVEQFICIKSTIQRSHEYALMILNSQSAEWICDFTNNTNNIIDCLDLINEEIIENHTEKLRKKAERRTGGRDRGRIKEEAGVEKEKQKGEEEAEKEEEDERETKEEEKEKEEQEQEQEQEQKEEKEAEEEEEQEQEENDDDDDDQKSYDLEQLFDKIKARLPLQSQRDEIVSKFVIRIILIYSRSNSIPKFSNSKSALDTLTRNPYFFVDVLYVHEPPCSENLCEKIYNEIATLDTRNVSYILEVGRNAAKLHDNMGKLLAHPLQRAPQKDI